MLALSRSYQLNDMRGRYAMPGTGIIPESMLQDERTRRIAMVGSSRARAPPATHALTPALAQNRLAASMGMRPRSSLVRDGDVRESTYSALYVASKSSRRAAPRCAAMNAVLTRSLAVNGVVLVCGSFNLLPDFFRGVADVQRAAGLTHTVLTGVAIDNENLNETR
jgi:hypothetical protein